MKEQQTTAIIYCRVSSTDQLEGTSLETQERLCRDYASRRGLTVSEVFIERGESAKTADRTELNRAIQYCSQRHGRIGWFIVYKLDRFARNQEDHVVVRAILRKAGTQLVSATEPIDATPVGRALEGILSVFAEFDNNVRSERTKQGMTERLRQGVWVFHVPVGYRRPSPKANIVPDLDQARYVKMLFAEYTKGTYTYKALAEWIGMRGFRVNGKRPYKQLVEKILRNPLYCGIMEAWGHQYVGAFEPLISRSLFEQCQPRSKSTQRAFPRSAINPLFPLRGLVVCARCGARLTGSSCTSKSGKRHPYYHHGLTRCPDSRFYPKQRVEQHFKDLLRDLTPSEEYLNALQEIVRERWMRDGWINDHKHLKREISALEAERQEIYASHRRGTYSDAEFTEQKNLIDAQLKQRRLLFSEKASVGGQLDLPAALKRSLADIRDPEGTWVRLEHDYQLRLQFQRRVFQQLLQYDGNSLQPIGTPGFSLIYQLSKQFDGSKATMVRLLRKRWNTFVSELQEWDRLL